MMQTISSKQLKAILLFILTFFTFSNIIFADINEGLVAYYPFNGNANDESGNEHSGIIQGATLTTDRFGNIDSAYSFNGIDNNIELENTASYDMFSGFSLVAWVKFTNSAPQSIISKHRNYILNSYNICTWERIVLNTNNRSTYIETPTTYNDGNWHFVVGIYNGAGNTDATSFIYVDGVLMVSGDTVYTIGSTENLRIGSDSSLSFFNGTIDDVRIYNRPLTETEIKELYYLGENECHFADSDEDGVIDFWDKCPQTSLNSYVNRYGCPESNNFPLSGRISLKGQPLTKGTATLFQSGELFQKVPIDINGSFEFNKVAEDKSINIMLRKTVE